jgi:hypothetical protein
MKTFARFSFIATIAVFVVSGCAHTQMTKRSVIQIANHAAEAAGYHLDQYKKPNAKFDHGSTNGTWSVSYDPIHSTPPVHEGLQGTMLTSSWFEILVDDKTGTTKLATVR